jgi:chemotaxis family two-component system sensor kinase Cph1
MDKTVETISNEENHYIQPHGALLVLDRDLKVIQYSENVSKLLEIPIHQIVMTPIANFLESENANENILSWLSHANNQYKQLNWRAKQKKIIIWTYIQQTPDYILLEIEPLLEPKLQNDNLFHLSQYVMDSAKTSSNSLNIEQILQNTCEDIRRMTGYDRVIIYQFGIDEHPTIVVGESAKKGLRSYLGLHFPADFISQNIKENHFRLPLQYIPSLQITGVKMIPEINPLTNHPLDLTHTNIGMITEEERKYLNNMEADATTSIAIIHDNTLWGVIACLNKEKKYLPVNVRLILLLIGSTLAKQIFSLEQIKDAQEEQRIATVEASLAQNIMKEDSLIYALDHYHSSIMELLFATGMSIFFQDNLFNYGKTPTHDDVLKLIDWIKSKNMSSYQTDCLSKDFPDSIYYKDTVSGLLLLTITAIDKNYILFYRPEFIHSIPWAENPNAILDSQHLDISATHFIQPITQHALPWTEYDIKSSDFIRTLIVNKQLNDLLKIKSTHDPLTGLLNHLYLEEQLKIEILRASREAMPITLMQIQIDSFRKIVDEFGQQAGDIVLSVFSKLLNSYFREYDYLYRSGGEDFILLLPNMSYETAVERATILHANITHLTINFEEKTLPRITVCTGIAMYPEDGMDVPTLLSATRSALYQAQKQGKNQIVIAGKVINPAQSS